MLRKKSQVAGTMQSNFSPKLLMEHHFLQETSNVDDFSFLVNVEIKEGSTLKEKKSIQAL